ncbi:DNA internalization-related competence protein ComEC/Rec2 [Bacillus sp. 03113]|uniref:DNA internalization-related competence protein ComEC/Rec2 n=1 Tax=Bacillus sp. 03113 TaxID=2578211 RepID=UPI00215BD0DC|nr:DNA internalization-related competence protein ComEC/Rec2 [Bacillus sp. 03113]
MTVYFAAAALLGLLVEFVDKIFFIMIFFILLYYVKINKSFSYKKLLILMVVFIVYFLLGHAELKQNHTVIPEQAKYFSVLFTDTVKIDGDRLYTYGNELKYDESIVLTYQIKSEEEKKKLQDVKLAGSVCPLIGVLEEPEPSRNQNAFHYKNYLNRKHIHWILKLNQFDPALCKPQKNSLISFLQSLRQKGISLIQKNFPKETIPISIALVFGEREFMDSDLSQAYRELGIVHLLAISGSNVGVVVWIVFIISIRLGITREKIQLYLIFFLPFFAVLAGNDPPVNRAVLMAMFVLFGKKWGKSWELLSIDYLSIAFLFYLFFSPFDIFNIGFQLSFIICFSLFLSSSILQKCTQPFWKMIFLSFIAQLTTAPILLFHFYELPVTAIFTNMIFVPIYSFVLFPYVLCLLPLQMLFGEYVSFLFFPFTFFVQMTNDLAILLSRFPLNTVVLGKPNLFVLYAYILTIPSSFRYFEKKKHPYYFFIPVVIMFIQYMLPFLSPVGEITMIDVGQGDSIFIQEPFGKGNYLIDTGGTISFQTEHWRKKDSSFEVGKDTVVPFLKSKRVTIIDKLILTHGDMDHIGGALSIINDIKIKEIILPIAKDRSDLEREIMEKAVEKKIKVTFVHSNQGWTSGDSTFKVLSPMKEESGSKNDGSVVLYTILGGKKWLFTGDLEENGEKQLMDKYPELDIDILKVAHHGSDSSTSQLFLEHVSPKFALISSGIHNRYGHPHKEIIGRLKEKNITILRTDHHGAITYTFIGNSGTFSTVNP